MKKSVLAACLAVYLVTAALFAAYLLGAFTGESEKVDFAMDTVVSVKIKGRNPDETAQGAINVIKELESACLSRTNKNSDVFRLNSSRAISDADSKTLSVINAALAVCEKSGGAFDVTLGAVSDLWDFKSGKAELPEQEKLSAAVADSGYKNISVSGSSVSVSGNAQLDLGSVGKGAACDSVREYLSATGAKEAVVSVGGSILLYGEHDFEVGIRDPFGSSSEYIGVLTVGEGCVSTSGIYERGFDLGGVRYHHILNSETGYPVQNGLVSVTVVSESGVVSDSLSTACFALGIEKGAALAEEYGAGVVFITEDKSVYASDNLKNSLALSAGYSFAE